MGEYERRKSKGEETGQAIKRTTFYYMKRFLFGGYLITVLLGRVMRLFGPLM